MVPLFAYEMYKSFPLESYTLFSFLRRNPISMIKQSYLFIDSFNGVKFCFYCCTEKFFTSNALKVILGFSEKKIYSNVFLFETQSSR